RVMDQFWATGLLAVVRLRRGEAEAARTAAETAINLLAGVKPTFWGTLEGLSGPAEVCLTLWEFGNGPSAGDRQLRTGALRACSTLWRYARVFQAYRPRAWLWRGLADWLSGRPARAHRAWRRSLKEARRLRMPLEEGLAYYEIGRHLSATDPARQTH